MRSEARPGPKALNIFSSPRAKASLTVNWPPFHVAMTVSGAFSSVRARARGVTSSITTFASNFAQSIAESSFVRFSFCRSFSFAAIRADTRSSSAGRAASTRLTSWISDHPSATAKGFEISPGSRLKTTSSTAADSEPQVNGERLPARVREGAMEQARAISSKSAPCNRLARIDSAS